MLRSTIKRLSGFVILALFVSAGTAKAQDNARTLPLSTESDEARHHFMQGLDEQYNVFTARAAEHYAEAARLDPDFALARLMHARLVSGPSNSERIEKMNEALADLSAATPEELLFGAAVREDFAGNDETARILMKAAAKLAPGDPYISHVAASLAGPFQSAEQYVALKEVTKKFPDFAPSHNMLAYASWRLGDEGGAVTAVQRYLDLMPNHPNAHDSYAEIMQFRGMYDEAIKHYEKALELDEEYHQGYLGLTDVYVLKGDMEKARGMLERLKERAPTPGARIDAVRTEANTYFIDGDVEKGLSTLLRAAEMAENEGDKGRAASAYRALAAAEAIAGDRAKVDDYLSRAENLGGKTAGQHVWAAYAYGMAGDAVKAREASAAYEEAIGEESEWVLTMKGLALLADKKYAGAEKTLLRSGLRNPVSQAAMARLQRSHGRTAEAELYEDDVRDFREDSAGNSVKTLAFLSLQKS